MKFWIEHDPPGYFVRIGRQVVSYSFTYWGARWSLNREIKKLGKPKKPTKPTREVYSIEVEG